MRNACRSISNRKVHSAWLAVACLSLAAPATSSAAPPPFGALTQLGGTAGCVVDAGDLGCADGTALAGASAVTVSPDGQNAYVAAGTSDAVAVFARDAQTGELSQLPGQAGCVSETGTGGACADAVALDGARSVAVSPDGLSVYVASPVSDAIAVLERSPLTGALAQLAGTSGCVVNGPSTDIPGCDNAGKALDGATSVAVSPDGANAYVASSGADAIAVFARSADGSLAQLADPLGCVVNGPSADITGCNNAGKALDGAAAVAASPDGANAYVAAKDSNAVAMLARGAGGALAQPTSAAGCIVDGPSPDIGGCNNSTITNGLALPQALTVAPDGLSVSVAANVRSGGAIRGPAVATLKRRVEDITSTNPLGRLTSSSAGCIGPSPCSNEVTGIPRALDGVADVAIAPEGRSAYAAAPGSSAVAVLRRVTGEDAAPGPPAQLPGLLAIPAGDHGCIVDEPFSPDIDRCQNVGRALGGATGVAVSPDARHVYVASATDGGVAAFDRSLQGEPVCVPSLGSVPAGVPTAVGLSCTDPDGDPMTFSIVSGPSHGALGAIDQATGTVAYTPDPGFPHPGEDGQDSFAFKATDGTDDSTTSFLSLTVLRGPTAPASAVAQEAPGAGGATIKVFGRSVRLTRHGIARVALRCRLATESCQGTLTLKTDRARNRKSGRRVPRLTLGKRSFSIPAGKTRPIEVRIRESGRRLLGRHRMLWAEATASDRGGAIASATAKRTFLLKAA